MAKQGGKLKSKAEPDEDLSDSYLKDGLVLMNILGELQLEEGAEPPPPGRELGTVEKFAEKRGFGLIVPKDGGERVFAHWTQIHSSDKWPRLVSGMRVEYEPRFEKGKRVAVNVTAPGGSEINIEEEEAVDKEFEPTSFEPITGTVSFFHRAGYGFIETDTAIFWPDDLPAGSTLYVSRQDLVLDVGSASRLEKGMRVQFRVRKPEAKPCVAIEVTHVGGKPLAVTQVAWVAGGTKRGAAELEWEGAAAAAIAGGTKRLKLAAEAGEESDSATGGGEGELGWQGNAYVPLLTPKVRKLEHLPQWPTAAAGGGELAWMAQLSSMRPSSSSAAGLTMGEGAGSAAPPPLGPMPLAPVEDTTDAVTSYLLNAIERVQAMYQPEADASQAAAETEITASAIFGDVRDTTFKHRIRCMFFAEGRCNRAETCKFSHNMEDEGPAPMALESEPCKFWARGRCMRGNKCAYVHA